MHQNLAIILQQFNNGKNSFIVLIPEWTLAITMTTSATVPTTLKPIFVSSGPQFAKFRARIQFKPLRITKIKLRLRSWSVPIKIFHKFCEQKIKNKKSGPDWPTQVDVKEIGERLKTVFNTILNKQNKSHLVRRVSLVC